MTNITIALRVLARLLDYPNAALRAQLPLLRAALHDAPVLSRARRGELDSLIDELVLSTGLESEERYVELFDRGRATSLHLFEHVHGDSRERGPAMIDLGQMYAAAGLFLADGELPDYLPVVLEYASTQPPREARAFLAELAHILNALCAALQQRHSHYAAIPAALLELAGERVTPVKIVPDEPVDATWDEPAAFGGCSTAGQSKPGTAQPVHFVRTNAHTQGAAV